MTPIEPTRKDSGQPGPKKKYSASLRLWHWANAVLISGSLLTVLVNATLNDPAAVTPVIQDELTKGGVRVSAQQAGSVAHALEDQVWAVHTYFGYVLAGLLLFRLILEFFQLADQKFIRKLRSALQQFQDTKRKRELAQHEIVVKSIYVVFYLVLAMMTVTGLFLAFEDLLVPFKSIRHSVKEIHGFCMYLVIAFITLHIAGVFLTERKDSAGITSDMINGGRNS